MFELRSAFLVDLGTCGERLFSLLLPTYLTWSLIGESSPAIDRFRDSRLIGSLYGSGRPLLDIPHLVTLYQAGELKLREPRGPRAGNPRGVVVLSLAPTISIVSTMRCQRWPLAKVRAASSVGDTVALACFVILQ